MALFRRVFFIFLSILGNCQEPDIKLKYYCKVTVQAHGERLSATVASEQHEE